MIKKKEDLIKELSAAAAAAAVSEEGVDEEESMQDIKAALIEAKRILMNLNNELEYEKSVAKAERLGIKAEKKV